MSQLNLFQVVMPISSICKPVPTSKERDFRDALEIAKEGVVKLEDVLKDIGWSEDEIRDAITDYFNKKEVTRGDVLRKRDH